MNRFAHWLVAPEAKRHVGNTAGNFRVRQIFSNPRAGFDKVHRVVVVLFDAGRNRENIRIENNIFGRETNLVDEDVVAALADFSFAFEGV
ncbi:MAG: hypothetical protein RL358_1074 [Pseudomonadota bacterium]